MKKIIIATGFLCFSLFAFAGEKDSFVSLSFGSAFLPTKQYDYSGVNGTLTYGHRVTSQSFGVIGLDFSSELEGAMIFRYEHNFTSNMNWEPGVSASVLIGVANKSSSSESRYKAALGLGVDLGLFLKLGPSTGWQGVAQTGVKYFSGVGELGKSFGDKFRHYISVALRKNF